MLAKKVQLCTPRGSLSWLPAEGEDRGAWFKSHPLDPNSKDKFVQEFLGVVQYCCLWMSEFAEMARHQHNRGVVSKPLIQTDKRHLRLWLQNSSDFSANPSTSSCLQTFSSVCPRRKTHYKRVFYPNSGAMEMPCAISIQTNGSCSHRLAHLCRAEVSPIYLISK